MAQIFPKWSLRIPLFVGLGVPIAVIAASVFAWYYFSPKHTDVGYQPKQPVPYSHAFHVGELNLDCRYCHVSVETSAVSNVPPTQTCMNCHQTVKRDSDLLEPIRTSFATGKSMRWNRVHKLPDYAYFAHSPHVRAGVGCVSCHGRIDQMEVVRQVEPLSMRWCLECHRDFEPHLRPQESVTDMNWRPGRDQAEVAAAAVEALDLKPPVDCSGCHR